MSFKHFLTVPVTFRRPDTTPDDYGKPSGNFIDYKTDVGFLDETSGKEVVKNSVVNVANSVLIVMPDASIDASFKVLIGGELYNILHPKRVDFGHFPHLELYISKVDHGY